MFNFFLLIIGIFVLFNFIASAIEGQAAFVSTRLDQSISRTSSVVPVTSVSNFPSTGFLHIDEEIITYDTVSLTCPAPFQASPACFLDISRGESEEGGNGRTTSTDHEAGTGVFNRDTSAVNKLLNYRVRLSTNILEIGGTLSSLAELVTLLKDVWWVLTTFDYSFLEGEAWPGGPDLTLFLRFPLSIFIGVPANMVLIFAIVKGIR